MGSEIAEWSELGDSSEARTGASGPVFDSEGSEHGGVQLIQAAGDVEQSAVEEAPGNAQQKDVAGTSGRNDGTEWVVRGSDAAAVKDGSQSTFKDGVRNRDVVVTGLSNFSLFGDGLPTATVSKVRPEGPAKTQAVSGPKQEEDTSISEEFRAAKKSLCEALEKARELSAVLEASHVKLRGVGERIPNLEAAVEPLQAQSKVVRGLTSRIDRAMGPAAAVLKVFDNVHELEKVLLDDEGVEDVSVYLASITRLEDALDFLGKNCPVAVQWLQETVDFLGKSSATDTYRLHRLNDTLAALRHAQSSPEGADLDGGLLSMALEQLLVTFSQLMRQHSEPVALPEAMLVGQDGVEEAVTLAESNTAIHPEVIQKLQAIVHKLTQCRQLDPCVEAYRHARSSNALASLKQLDTQYLQYTTPETINTLEWNDLEGYIGLWTQQFEVAVKVLYGAERHLCSQVFSKAEPHVWRECFLRLSHPGMLLFLQFGEGVARSEKTPEKLFKLLDMFEALENLNPSVLEVFEGDGCTEMRVRVRELQKQLVHGSCQVLWEFSKQLLEGQNEGILPPDGSHPKLSSYVVNYVKYLVSEFYGPIMAQVLKIEQSWRQDVSKVGDRGLSHAVLTIMEALERNVEGRAKGYRDAALAHVFLMNNVQYMYDRSRKCEMGSLLGDAWLKEHRRKVEQHNTGYLKDGWGKVRGHLNREGLLVSSGGRGAARDLVKQRLRLFTTAFEETLQKHSRWSIPDEDLRKDVKQSVVQFVQSAYRSYIQSYGSLLDQGLAANRYLKYSPENLEHVLLNDLFLGPGNLQSPSLSRNGEGNSF